MERMRAANSPPPAERGRGGGWETQRHQESLFSPGHEKTRRRYTTSMRALAIAMLLAPSLAQAQCQAGEGSAYSTNVRLSPRAGRVCWHIVDVHEGASCAGAPAFSVELHCGQTRRMAVASDGRLISLLAPRVRERGWHAVVVTERGGRQTRIRLGDLPGAAALRGTIRLDIDRGAVRMRAGGSEARVPFAEVLALAR